MLDNKKSYYAIIPANVRYDESLPPNAKLLYGEITALCNAEGYCWASNKYFADLYGVTLRTVANWLRSLTDRGYIKSEVFYKDGSKEVERRFITIIQYPPENNFSTYGKEIQYPPENNFSTPVEKNFTDNNTSSNNTFNTTDEDIYISEKPTHKRFSPPTLEEVQAYCKERNNNVDAQKFYDYYSTANWYDGKGEKVKSWKQKVITWEKNDKPKQVEKKSNNIFLEMLKDGDLDEQEGSYSGAGDIESQLSKLL